MEYWWYDDGLKEADVLGEKPVPASLRSPQIPHRLSRHQPLASADRSRRQTFCAVWHDLACIQPVYSNRSCVYFVTLLTSPSCCVLRFVAWGPRFECGWMYFQIRCEPAVTRARIYMKNETQKRNRYRSRSKFRYWSCWLKIPVAFHKSLYLIARLTHNAVETKLYSLACGSQESGVWCVFDAWEWDFSIFQ